MSEPLVDTAVEQLVTENAAAEGQMAVDNAAPVAEVAAEPEITETDAVLAKLKELVAAAGSQAHAYIDDLIELAKKLV
ncbi:hypothetical protein [Serratia sp. M24T3]|uniref:hypothetical protein n=1 Tax=Serratia sp. M24T3 TaxID=932213 RepID=UPI0003165F8B|nr:hypothetical protein [Serratia sp. M24T3]